MALAGGLAFFLFLGHYFFAVLGAIFNLSVDISCELTQDHSHFALPPKLDSLYEQIVFYLHSPYFIFSLFENRQLDGDDSFSTALIPLVGPVKLNGSLFAAYKAMPEEPETEICASMLDAINEYVQVGDCLGTLLDTYTTLFFPLLDKLLPYLMPMWGKDRTSAEKRIAICIFVDVVEHCGDATFKLLFMGLAYVLSLGAVHSMFPPLNKADHGNAGWLST
ncbi:importin-5-like protein [Tanacetum coccineum]